MAVAWTAPKLDKRGTALESLQGEVGKLNALRGREVLYRLQERWSSKADKPPDESLRSASPQAADGGSGAAKGTGLGKTVVG